MAPKMNAMKKSDTAEMHYCVLSDGLWWSDELPRESLEEDAIAILRYLINFRSKLIAGTATDYFLPYWHEAQALFPNWPGFLPERCRNEPILNRQRRKLYVATMRSWIEADRELSSK